MSPEERRRRALATGLAPYLDAAAVAEAVALWQREYAGRPRFSLQGYVSELNKRFDLAGRRHDLHLSLVQAMSLPDHQLAADPLGQAGAGGGDGHPGTEAFQWLMRALWARLTDAEADQFRLDQLTDLRRAGLADDLRDTLEYWLNHHRAELPPIHQDRLRTLLNRSYVLLCERFGPVRADRLLKQAGEQVRHDHPHLNRPLGALL